MKPRFTNRQTPKLEQLTELQVRQLAVASVRLDNNADEPAAGFGVDRFRDFEVWDIVDAGGMKRFEAWVHDDEAGFVFFAGTEELLGWLTQGAFSSDDERAWQFVAESAENTDFGDSLAGAMMWELEEI